MKSKIPNLVDIINLEWNRAYDHFRLRLNERYQMDISFAEYVTLCQLPIENVYSERNKKIYIGWVIFREMHILVCKERQKPKRLRTAMVLKVIIQGSNIKEATNQSDK